MNGCASDNATKPYGQAKEAIKTFRGADVNGRKIAVKPYNV
jgi:hypothetical protein